MTARIIVIFLSSLFLSITNLKISHSDFKSNIHQYVKNKSQSNFNNKCSFLNLNRQDQTNITRCRIGHTRRTYLLNNEQRQLCISCNEPFIVKHVLIICIVWWLVGCFGLNGPLRQVFQSISGRPPERGRKEERNDRREKKCANTPPTPTARALGPCPTII